MAAAFQEHMVSGGGGVALHVREWGNPNGPPLLLIHGWSQSHLCWQLQYTSDLAEEFRIVALDNRGHGQSEKPSALEAYNDGQLWADDIAAVIGTLGLQRPVLVGWSYGGFIIGDYVQAYGQDQLGAVNYVAAAVLLTPEFTHLGPGFLENAPPMMSSDAAVAIEGTRRFLAACTAAPLPVDLKETMLCFNMLTPPEVRQHLVTRQLDYTAVLRALQVPTLVTIGMADTVVLPAMGDFIVATAPGAVASRYAGVGHAPFIEDAPRFNRELAGLARQIAR